MKHDWRNCYSKQIRKHPNAGSRLKPEYRIHFEDDGTQSLMEVGTIDIYAEIQSHRQSVDIHHLIDIYSRTGDTSVFDRASASYGDISGIPQNYADLLNLRAKMENEFARLPAEARSKFDNDINKYIAQYGSENWASALGIINNPISDTDNASEKEEKIDA